MWCEREETEGKSELEGAPHLKGKLDLPSEVKVWCLLCGDEEEWGHECILRANHQGGTVLKVGGGGGGEGAEPQLFSHFKK